MDELVFDQLPDDPIIQAHRDILMHGVNHHGQDVRVKGQEVAGGVSIT